MKNVWEMTVDEAIAKLIIDGKMPPGVDKRSAEIVLHAVKIGMKETVKLLAISENGRHVVGVMRTPLAEVLQQIDAVQLK